MHSQSKITVDLVINTTKEEKKQENNIIVVVKERIWSRFIIEDKYRICYNKEMCTLA